MIEVILKEPVETLGGRGDIVKVADGYARNYLLPRKLALAVTSGNKRQIDAERQRALAREKEERGASEALAAKLAQVECVVASRVGDRDILYGSVTSADIADALARLGFDVDKRKIQLDEPIKALGEYSVPLKLHKDVVAPIKVLVVKAD